MHVPFGPQVVPKQQPMGPTVQGSPTFEHPAGCVEHCPAQRLPAQHWSGALQPCPIGTHATPPQTPFAHVEPALQQGREPSQAAPSRMHAPPHSPPTHGAPAQQGLTVEQSAPSGMQVGCGWRQRPLEQTRPEQQGLLPSHVLPSRRQQTPFVHSPAQHVAVPVQEAV